MHQGPKITNTPRARGLAITLVLRYPHQQVKARNLQMVRTQELVLVPAKERGVVEGRKVLVGGNEVRVEGGVLVVEEVVGTLGKESKSQRRIIRRVQ